MPTKGGVILPNEAAVAGKPEVAGFFRSGSAVRHASAMVPVDPDSHDPIQVGGKPVGFERVESFAFFAANQYMVRYMWRVPTGKRFYPTSFSFGGLTGGGVAELSISRWLQSYDFGTNTNTVRDPALANVGTGQNRFFSRISGVITTSLSALATTLSVTPTDVSGSFMTAQTMPFAASAPVNSVLQIFPPGTLLISGGTPGAVTSYGFSGIGANVESPATAATGVMQFFGDHIIAEGRHAAGDARIISLFPGEAYVDANDFLIVYASQPAVTAYQREYNISGYMTDIPA